MSEREEAAKEGLPMGWPTMQRLVVCLVVGESAERAAVKWAASEGEREARGEVPEVEVRSFVLERLRVIPWGWPRIAKQSRKKERSAKGRAAVISLM